MSTKPKGPYKAEYSTTIGPGWAVRIGTSEPPVYHTIIGNVRRDADYAMSQMDDLARAMNLAYAAGVEAGRGEATVRTVDDCQTDSAICDLQARVAALESAPRAADAKGLSLDYHAGRIDGNCEAIGELRRKVDLLQLDMATVKAACADSTEIDTESDWQRRAEIAEAQVAAVLRYLEEPNHSRDEFAKGINDACDTIREWMGQARERFGAA